MRLASIRLHPHGVCERKEGQERDADCDDVGPSWQHVLQWRKVMLNRARAGD